MQRMVISYFKYVWYERCPTYSNNQSYALTWLCYFLCGFYISEKKKQDGNKTVDLCNLLLKINALFFKLVLIGNLSAEIF